MQVVDVVVVQLEEGRVWLLVTGVGPDAEAAMHRGNVCEKLISAVQERQGLPDLNRRRLLRYQVHEYEVQMVHLSRQSTFDLVLAPHALKHCLLSHTTGHLIMHI